MKDGIYRFQSNFRALVKNVSALHGTSTLNALRVPLIVN